MAWRFSAAQAIRRYSFTPPTTRNRRIRLSSGMTHAGSWLWAVIAALVWSVVIDVPGVLVEHCRGVRLEDPAVDQVRLRRRVNGVSEPGLACPECV